MLAGFHVWIGWVADSRPRFHVARKNRLAYLGKLIGIQAVVACELGLRQFEDVADFTFKHPFQSLQVSGCSHSRLVESESAHGGGISCRER